MLDNFGRNITYLRLSVTDLCNYRCLYCMPAEGVHKLSHEDILTPEEIGEIVTAAASLGITKVRITGGEPLVRHGIIDICKIVSGVSGINDVAITTNAKLLSQMAVDLKKAGVNRLNISLDTLHPDTFARITRVGGLGDVLRGIEAAKDAGFEIIKTNTVLMKGVNDDEIRDIAELSYDTITEVRFIELMPIGEAAAMRDKFMPGSAVLEALPELISCGASGVSQTYKLPGASGAVGLINPISTHFCGECNRVRITSDGRLKPCLHSAAEFPLRGLHGDELAKAMKNAILAKPERHKLTDRASESERGMSAIGG